MTRMTNCIWVSVHPISLNRPILVLECKDGRCGVGSKSGDEGESSQVTVQVNIIIFCPDPYYKRTDSSEPRKLTASHLLLCDGLTD